MTWFAASLIQLNLYSCADSSLPPLLFHIVANEGFGRAFIATQYTHALRQAAQITR